MAEKEQRILTIHAHCSDLFNMSYDDKHYDGYVPRGLGIGGGDDVSLKIDLETGQILNWKPVSEEDILAAFDPEN